MIIDKRQEHLQLQLESVRGQLELKQPYFKCVFRGICLDSASNIGTKEGTRKKEEMEWKKRLLRCIYMNLISRVTRICCHKSGVQQLIRYWWIFESYFQYKDRKWSPNAVVWMLNVEWRVFGAEKLNAGCWKMHAAKSVKKKCLQALCNHCFFLKAQHFLQGFCCFFWSARTV